MKWYSVISVVLIFESRKTMKRTNPMSWNAVVLISIAGLVLAPGCATLIHGADQLIHITSTPSGAHVKIDGIPRGNTPLFPELERGKSHTVAFSLEGYETYQTVVKSRLSPWLFGNIIVFWVIGFVVDLATGAAKRLSPDAVHADLIPIE